MCLSLPPDWKIFEGKNDNIHLCNPQITNYTAPGIDEELNEWRMKNKKKNGDVKRAERQASRKERMDV